MIAAPIGGPPAGIEDYFGEINAAASDAERRRIGERYGIRVVPG